MCIRDRHREVVQVGAVRLDAENDLAEIGRLDVLVAPQRNPVLSDYFVDLTGITNDRIAANAIDLADALDRLCRFAAGAPIVSNGSDNQVVVENCALIGISNPLSDTLWSDIGPMLRRAFGIEHLHSADIPRLLGQPAPGRGHDALADARAIAAGLRHLQARGEA